MRKVTFAGDAGVLPEIDDHHLALEILDQLTEFGVGGDFQFDFGSPNAYLAEKVIPAIERRNGVKFDYVPVLLGGIYKATGNMSPFDSLRGIKNKPEYQALETERFIRRHNITTFRKNQFFPVNTLMLMRGAVAAKFEDMFEPYFRAACPHMWEEPKKMADLEVFQLNAANAAFLSFEDREDLTRRILAGFGRS